MTRAWVWLAGLMVLGTPAWAIEKRVLETGGLKRSYHLYVPAQREAAQPQPLLLVLHGGGMTGAQMAEATQYRFNAFADAEGALVVYPDAHGKHWNDGRKIWRYASHRQNVDDVQFLVRLIEAVAAEHPVDPAHVFVIGMSNGAMMAQRLACEQPQRITAIASVGGTLAANVLPACQPQDAVSVLMINGTQDRITPWEGGPVRFGPLRLGKKSSIPDTVTLWARANECQGEPAVSWLPDAAADDEMRVRQETYACRHNAAVTLYAIEGGGHTWPGAPQYLSPLAVGKTSTDLDATAAIWQFFQTHAACAPGACRDG